MSEMYLILHKVDGKPAFDVACKLETIESDEEVWIVPTSGHRAYPYWKANLADLLKDAHRPMTDGYLAQVIASIPEEWPEHYQNAREVHEPSERMTFNIGALLSGLIPKVHRRF